MNFKKKKISTRSLVFVFLISLISCSLVMNLTNALEKEGGLDPGGYYLEYFEYSNQTESRIDEYNSNRLVFNPEQNKFSLFSENNVSVYLFNETELSKYLAGDEFVSKKVWINITKVDQKITYQYLINEYNLDTFIHTNEEGEKEKKAYAYVIIDNEINGLNQYSLRIQYENRLNEFLENFFRIAIVLAFSYCSYRFLRRSKIEKEENEEIKAHILMNYGLGLTAGALATLVWEIFHWYRIMSPRDNWENVFEFKDMPIEIFSANYLSFLTMLCLGLAIMFLSNTVERDVQNKKIPYFTYFLMSMEALLFLGIFVPVILVVVIYIWIISLALSGINIIASYVKVVKHVTGVVKKNVLKLAIGLTLTYTILPMRIFISPEYVANLIVLISLYVMYDGISATYY